MAVAVAHSSPLKLDAVGGINASSQVGGGGVKGASNGNVVGSGHLLSSLTSNNSGHLSSHNSGRFLHDLDHAFDAEVVRCCKCFCLPVDCHCVESHPVGPTYCDSDMPKEYETHVQVFVRVPEMREVEETHYRKEVEFQKRKVFVPRSFVTYDVVEHYEMVPVVRYVTKTRQEIEFRIFEEEIEITEIEQCVEFEDVCEVRREPRVITEEVEEIIRVPCVKEVQVTRLCEEWTGKYCEEEVEKFCSPGDFNLICEDSHHQHHGKTTPRKSKSSASSESGCESPSHRPIAPKPKVYESVHDGKGSKTEDKVY